MRRGLHALINPRSVLVVLAALAGPATAFATLGGDVASIQADQSAMNASLQITAEKGYAIHGLRTQAGLAVREYLSEAGQVFAVAWRGPTLPDLRQLLGNYYAAFTAAAQAQRSGHGHLVIHRDDLVVESSGHMRAFFGRAYLPQQLPPGVKLSEIQ